MVDVTVAFNVEQQQWSHVFNVPTGCTIYQLKELMLKNQGSKQDLDAFELRLRGRRVLESEELVKEYRLDFEYLGPEEGAKAAAKEKQAKLAQDRLDRDTYEAQERINREKESQARQAQAERERRERQEQEQQRKQQEASAASPAAPSAQGPGPAGQEVEVTIKYAMDKQKQLVVRVMSNCTILDVRKAAMEILGEIRMSEMKIVKATGSSFTSMTDGESIGAKREFLAMGRKLEALQESPAPPSASAAPKKAPAPKHPPLVGKRTIVVWVSRDFDFKSEIEVEGGMTIAQVKDQLAASDPTGMINASDIGLGVKKPGSDDPAKPLRDTTVLTEQHLELDVTEAASGQEEEEEPEPTEPEGPPPWNLDTAKRMQWELMEGFRNSDFQVALDNLHKEFPDKNVQFRKKQAELFMYVQAPVLTKYGFEGDQRGMAKFMRSFTPEMGSNPDVMWMTGEINKLLRI